jgi:RNA polymerase sigma factor (sigma-70 family)
MKDEAGVTSRGPEVDEDARLWTLFQQGDDGAFEHLYQRLGPDALGWLRRAFRLQDADAANLAQYVFLCLYARRTNLAYDPERARFRTWFRSFARFRAVDELRRHRRHGGERSLEGNLSAEGALAERAEEKERERERQEEHREQLLACLERHGCLDEREKFVIRNGNAEGLGEMSQAAVARALGLSPGQVSKIKQSAIRKLAHCLSGIET